MTTFDYLVAIFVPFIFFVSVAGIIYYKLWIVPEREKKKPV